MAEDEPKGLTPGERRIQDAKFFVEHEEEFRLQYPGEIVAVVEGRVIGHSTEIPELLVGIERQGLREPAFIARPMSAEEHEEVGRFVSEMSFNIILHQFQEEPLP